MNKFLAALGLSLGLSAGAAHATYWNVFNIEGERDVSAAIVTYATRADMLTDTNRVGLFEPNTAGFGANIVDSGSDGHSYWNVFNIEGERDVSAAIVTYASLLDMLTDTNRVGLFEPDTAGFGANIVGSGSDGRTYWNVFNIEGERDVSAAIVTYASLLDMLTDTNRVGLFEPNSAGFGANIVGSGSDEMGAAAVPEPGSFALLALGLAVAAALRRTGAPRQRIDHAPA
ncbi:PEP-CTERM sorting domain-containing protein [Pseudorhodoferax sp.]|uniref:PEP-CTERM sorting domain-containing protein n=1 Tax=Pseudorhodoferax sp. TaxID=1993553 RepID=UPI002DD6A966|nr:PEP-CTERM sorting domain-containing protein [Pseudorhodoferax sp.]